MKNLRWQFIIIFLTGLVVGVLLLAEQPGGFSPLVPEPAKGGIYAEGLVGSLQRMNPVLDYYNSVDRDVDRLIFSGLVRFDDRGVAQPDLAESWGYTQDGTIYNFTLRPDIKWHDGEPLTSDDVLYTIDQIRADDSIYPDDLRTFWKDVEVKALSENTLQFRLPEAFAPFLDYLTFGILPRHLFGDLAYNQMIESPFNLRPVGSGPFRFDHLLVENDQITGVVLTAFEDYYGDKPYIEQVVFRLYPDASTAFDAYLEGTVQGISEITTDILPDVLREPNLSVYTGRRPELSLILFNLKDPQVEFLQDANVRKALATGLNRQWIIDRILGSQAIMADGPIFPGTWAYYEGQEHLDYDPELANDQLKDAGYVMAAEGETVRTKGEVPLSFTLLYPDDEQHALVAEFIQENWALIGVQVNLEALPYEELVYDHLDAREYQAALVDLNLSRSPDPDPYPFWDQAQATGGQNYTQWDNRVASEYLEQARTTTDMSERQRMYRNFQVVFSEDMPAIPLYYPVYTFAVDQQVQGIRMGPLFDTSDRYATILKWFMIAKPAAADTATPQP
ncbi:MAG: peptide ABC transporter substrate-binding protein [Chloroflexi bacterium]|nr:peptide ABC transporter substrate-binding protein [Anaerolineaceae bacterium]NMB86944.1 peptide ABC transporter substrate-binding protein [Chloroflexota bacterium]